MAMTQGQVRRQEQLSGRAEGTGAQGVGEWRQPGEGMGMSLGDQTDPKCNAERLWLLMERKKILVTAPTYPENLIMAWLELFLLFLISYFQTLEGLLLNVLRKMSLPVLWNCRIDTFLKYSRKKTEVLQSKASTSLTCPCCSERSITKDCRTVFSLFIYIQSSSIVSSLIEESVLCKFESDYRFLLNIFMYMCISSFGLYVFPWI